MSKRAYRNVGSYRGCENVDMGYLTDWDDPALLYDEKVYNYWDIEDALWTDFLEFVSDQELPNSYTEDEENFNTYVQEHIEDYLSDVDAGGYFKEGSNDWRD